MSELKAISGNEIRDDIDYNTRGIDPEDKEWCEYGMELCNTMYYIKSEADRYIAHQKMKRCLAMARACMEMQCETEQQADFAVRWEHRWLTLATYYKEMAK